MNGELFPTFRDPATCRENARDVLYRIVRRVKGAVAADSIGLDEGHLSKALGPNPGDRHLREHHVDGLLALATASERIDYWSARMAQHALVPAHEKIRTAEEKLADLRLHVVAECGKAGLAVVDAEMAKP